MASILQGLFGGAKPSAVPTADSDFADFAGAPDPVPVSTPILNTAGAAATPVPYTKWYNVHERHSISEFAQEGYIFLFIGVIVLVHLWGTSTNRRKAKKWMDIHGPALESEFALVGFGGNRVASADGDELNTPVNLIKEKAPHQFSTYATGRTNVAFLDVNMTLLQRYNPLKLFADYLVGFLFESMPMPTEKVEALMYPFDGKESLTVPGSLPGAIKDKSTYDNFVWAVVNKESMKRLRDERYDVSITVTKDHPKLPNWCTVMSESAEVTETLLTPELIAAIEEAGELMDCLVITDQPQEKPTTIEETNSKKRIYLSTAFTTSSKTTALFDYFLRLPDILVQKAHFRPEVTRKVKATRDELITRIQKAGDAEKAEERKLEAEKAKKLKRDLELSSLDAKKQKKYLEKEKERDLKKMQKKQTTRG